MIELPFPRPEVEENAAGVAIFFTSFGHAAREGEKWYEKMRDNNTSRRRNAPWALKPVAAAVAPFYNAIFLLLQRKRNVSRRKKSSQAARS